MEFSDTLYIYIYIQKLMKVQQCVCSLTCSQLELLFINDMFFFTFVDHKQSVDNYLSAISNKDNIVDVMVAKLIFLGPPMQGKTVTRQRMTKAIKNIASDKDKLDKSNTGVSEQDTVLIKSVTHSTALARDDNDWSIVDLERECLLCLEPSQTKSEVPPQLEHSVTEHKSPSPNRRKIMPSSEELPEPQDATDVQSKDQQGEIIPICTATDSLKIRAESPNINIRRTLERRKKYNLVDLKLKFDMGCLLYMQDTGGQPELMDCLPALTIGPALYLLFCKLDANLTDPYVVGYRSSDGETLPIYSHFKVQETLLTALASIASMGYSGTDNATNIVEQESSRDGCVYLIGTHKDEAIRKGINIDTLESNLRQLLLSTFFYKKGLIKLWYKDDLPSQSGCKDIAARLVYPLDNMNGDHEEIKCLQVSIHKRLNSLFGRKKIPNHWLVFGICLRGSKDSVITLKKCYEIGKQVNMTEKEAESALHFLHYNLGICMHFYNVPALKDIVITNTQSVYRSLTTLIEAVFKTGKLHEADANRFKRTGQFQKKMFAKVSGFILPLNTLVKILSHLNIIASIPSNDPAGSTFFMPCILENASDEDIDAAYGKKDMLSDMSPLFVRYECGFIPIGVFSAVIAHLVHQSSQNVSIFIRCIIRSEQNKKDDFQRYLMIGVSIQYACHQL